MFWSSYFLVFIVFAFLCCFSVDMVLCFSFFTEPKKGGFGISTCRPHGALLHCCWISVIRIRISYNMVFMMYLCLFYCMFVHFSLLLLVQGTHPHCWRPLLPTRICHCVWPCHTKVHKVTRHSWRGLLWLWRRDDVMSHNVAPFVSQPFWGICADLNCSACRWSWLLAHKCCRNGFRHWGGIGLLYDIRALCECSLDVPDLCFLRLICRRKMRNTDWLLINVVPIGSDWPLEI